MESQQSLQTMMLFMLLSSALLAGTFFYVWYYSVRQRYVLLWAIAWLASLPHLAFELHDRGQASATAALLSSLFPVVTALLKLAGCFELAQRRLPWQKLTGGGLLFVIWGLAASHVTSNPILHGAPGAILLGTSYLWIAWLFYRVAVERQVRGSRIVAGLFVIAALHELDYPLLANVPGLNTLGYMLAAVLALATSFSLLILILEEKRTETELERARVHSILDHLPVGVLVISPTGDLLHSNSDITPLLAEYAGGGTDRVRQLEALLFAKSGDSDLPISRALATGLPVAGRELEVRDAAGGHRPMLVNAGPVNDAQGRLLGAVVVFEDLREHKRLQAEVARSERLQGLGTLAAGVAHDFNNALTMILGHAELAAIAATDPVVRQQLQIITGVASDSASIVRRIQDVARTRVTRDEVVFDLAPVVREIVDLARPRWRDQAQAAGILYDLHTELSHDVSVLGQPAEIREALLNLLLNAIDAMPGGGRVSLTVSKTATEAVLVVADNGSGMPEEVRNRVFDPFFTTKGQRGTGLGLSVVYGIIQRHSGTISVESKEAVGTTFTLRLPIATPACGVSAPVAVRSPSRALHLLVVDDEPLVRTLTRALLEREGHTVVTSADGNDALTQLGQHEFDGILTDLGMPGMNGWQLAAAARERYPRIPIVLVTGWGDTVTPEQNAKAGVAAVLPKPFTRVQLMQMVDSIAVARQQAFAVA